MTKAGAPKDQRISDWRTLQRGEEIELQGSSIFRGWIDDFTEGREVLWIQLINGNGRMMFHQEDGWLIYQVRRLPSRNK